VGALLGSAHNRSKCNSHDVAAAQPRRLDHSAETDAKLQNAQAKHAAIATVLALGDFERFVFVLSVLERYSDQDCSVLLRCSREDVRGGTNTSAQALLTYRQTIQQAFRGVSDSLVEYRKDREFREYQQQLALSAQDAAQLSEMRYRGGAASYLEVLTNETNYFDAQLGLAQAQLNELAGLVRIYRNLGGGWQ
jgi:outer membrane efflux protein